MEIFEYVFPISAVDCILLTLGSRFVTTSSRSETIGSKNYKCKFKIFLSNLKVTSLHVGESTSLHNCLNVNTIKEFHH